MTERIDHVKVAQRNLDFVGKEAMESPEALVTVTAALVHATLALVEQQRISNRLMLAALVADVELRTGQNGSRVGLLGACGVFHHPKNIGERAHLDDDIREALGL